MSWNWLAWCLERQLGCSCCSASIEPTLYVIEQNVCCLGLAWLELDEI